MIFCVAAVVNRLLTSTFLQPSLSHYTTTCIPMDTITVSLVNSVDVFLQLKESFRRERGRDAVRASCGLLVQIVYSTAALPYQPWQTTSQFHCAGKLFGTVQAPYERQWILMIGSRQGHLNVEVSTFLRTVNAPVFPSNLSHPWDP